MPKTRRKKDRAKAAGASGPSVAERMARLRARVEDLSTRLASAEETLLAAGEIAIARSEQRMASLLERTNRAGQRLAADFSALAESALTSTDSKGPAPAPRAAAKPASRKRTTATKTARRAPAKPATAKATTTKAATAKRTGARKTTTGARKATTGARKATTRAPRRRTTPGGPATA